MGDNRRFVTAAALAVAAVAAVAVGLNGLRPAESPGPTAAGTAAPGSQGPHVGGQANTGDPAVLALVPRIRVASVLFDADVHAAPDGAPILDTEQRPFTIQRGTEVALLEGPITNGEVDWYRVYALPNDHTGPTDFVGWVAEHDAAGVGVLALQEAAGCPVERTPSQLGVLDQFTRAQCLGAGSFAIRGWTWNRTLPTWYRITPSWFGSQNEPTDPTIALHDDPAHRGGGLGPPTSVDVQLPPGLDTPPLGFLVDVVAHVADPRSRDCIRDQGQFPSVPPDVVPNLGPAWCATRIVVEQWTPILGPEQRPIDPLQPQLHRHPLAGPNVGCAGVGMGPLVFRMDPTALDPVWLAPVGVAGDVRVIPNFDPTYRVVFDGALAIVDKAGKVVARDGTPVNPDGNLAGHPICPTGLVVYFD